VEVNVAASKGWSRSFHAPAIVVILIFVIFRDAATTSVARKCAKRESSGKNSDWD
jgi:hypothetical protein